MVVDGVAGSTAGNVPASQLQGDEVVALAASTLGSTYINRRRIWYMKTPSDVSGDLPALVMTTGSIESTTPVRLRVDFGMADAHVYRVVAVQQRQQTVTWELVVTQGWFPGMAARMVTMPDLTDVGLDAAYQFMTGTGVAYTASAESTNHTVGDTLDVGVLTPATDGFQASVVRHVDQMVMP